MWQATIFSNATNSSSTYASQQIKSQSEYEWYELWKLEWWTDEWTTTQFVTIIVILLIILACIIFSTIGCIYCACKTKTNKVESPKQSDSIVKNNKYNELNSQMDTDIDNDNSKHKQSIAVIMETNENSEIELVKHDNDMDERESESDSEFNSEELFGTNATVSDHQTFGSDIDSTPTLLMDKASMTLKSSVKAAEMTVGSRQSFSEQLNEINATHQRDIIREEDGLVWDNWLKNTLQDLFPDNWINIFSHFKQQKITQDVLISLNTDKHKKVEIWKELIPIIGDRIRFQKAWTDELMRQQLSKQT